MRSTGSVDVGVFSSPGMCVNLLSDSVYNLLPAIRFRHRRLISSSLHKDRTPDPPVEADIRERYEIAEDATYLAQCDFRPLFCNLVLDKHLLGMLCLELADEAWIPKLTCDS